MEISNLTWTPMAFFLYTCNMYKVCALSHYHTQKALIKDIKLENFFWISVTAEALFLEVDIFQKTVCCNDKWQEEYAAIGKTQLYFTVLQ